MGQRFDHRCAGNPHDAGKWMVEFEDNEHRARNGERTGDQGKRACSIARREKTKTEEDHNEPYYQRNQQWR